MTSDDNETRDPRLVAGSVEAIKNRKTGEITGYLGRLPRSLSKAPPGCKSTGYRQPVGEPCATRAEAIRGVNAALDLLRKPGMVFHGRTVGDFVAAELKARLKQAIDDEDIPTEARARKMVATWKSIDKCWLKPGEGPGAPFYNRAIHSVGAEELRHWFGWLKEQKSKRGKRLALNWQRNVRAFLQAVFERAEVRPNPVLEVKFDARKKPKVEFLSLGMQVRFFSSDKIDRRDRVMAGVGMGLGLRVGELLALEEDQVLFTGERRGQVMIAFGGPDQSPTKGRERMPVELFEPGLGFLKIWMRDYYQGGRLVFGGPKGAYQRHWPDQFPGWSAAAGKVGKPLTSHVMRHTYAVSMLSGFWGYPLQTLGFVKDQLRHKHLTTTERYYAFWAPGTFKSEVDQMVGGQGDEPPSVRVLITAEMLLNGMVSADKQRPMRGLSSGLSDRAHIGINTEKNAKFGRLPDATPSLTQNGKKPDKTKEKRPVTGRSGQSEKTEVGEPTEIAFGALADAQRAVPIAFTGPIEIDSPAAADDEESA